MFTGIVQSQGEVLSLNPGENFVQITMKVESWVVNNLQLGASVANNGTCLTVVAFEHLDEKSASMTFDVIDETLKQTNLGKLEVGSLVNIERSMKVGDEIGGHQVSGHIQAQAKLIERIDSEDNCEMTFELDEKWGAYLFAKGFIAVNGISLTLGEVEKGHFKLHLIPETLARTNLGTMHEGDSVNIEFDQQTVTIVDTIERLAASGKLQGMMAIGPN